MIKTDIPLLLPPPHYLCLETGVFEVMGQGAIHLGGQQPADLRFTATQLQGRLIEVSGRTWPINAESETGAIYLAVDSTLPRGTEACRLDITPEAIEIRGGSPAGVFYGCQTLFQLLRQYGTSINMASLRGERTLAVCGV